MQWEDEVEIAELETSVFIFSGERVKNNEDRLVVLNSVARQVVEEVRGENPQWIFTSRGHSVTSMYNTAWKPALEKIGLPFGGIHDLKHACGRRLHSAGVSFDDRHDLLGHKSARITTHYSAPELINLIQASERVCVKERHKSDTIVYLRKKIPLRVVSNRSG